MRGKRLRERGVDAAVHDAERLEVALIELYASMRDLRSELGELEAESLIEGHGITAVETISTTAAGSNRLETSKSEIAG